MLRMFSWKWAGFAALLLVIPFTIISCGGEDSDTAGGGIGGTGIYTGVVSGFGSVFVNGIEFDTTGTLFTVDGNSNATEDDLAIGMKVELEAINGKAETVLFEPEVKGLISDMSTAANNRFEVLGQTIIVNSATIFKGQGINDLMDLLIDDYVRVSGLFDADGNIVATFIELEEQASQQTVKVKGTISAHNSVNMTFVINNLTVNYSGIPDPPAIDDGSFVEVKGNLVGSSLVATELELKNPGPPANPGQQMEVEGIITLVTSSNDFEVNGQSVQTNSLTIFKNGTPADIAVNIRIDVEGTVDGNNILIADEVEFRSLASRDTKIEGTVENVDTLNSTVTVFGITVTVNNSTIFKDESRYELRPFNLADVQTDDFLEIKGLVDSSGAVIAIKLERKDDPGPAENSLKGPVDSEDDSNSSLEILGVTVDVSGFPIPFEDANGTLFDIIEPGDIVEVKGYFDTSTNVFIADKVEID
ncbi:MAG: DUF5666 domain-containing protein [Thermodesulfobacteriota bacterium]